MRFSTESSWNLRGKTNITTWIKTITGVEVSKSEIIDAANKQRKHNIAINRRKPGIKVSN